MLVPSSPYQQGAVKWPRMRDSLLHYAGSEYDGFNQPFGPLAKADKQYRLVEPETGRRYQLTSLTAPGAGTRGHPQYEFLGVTRFWRYSEEKMQRLLEAGRVVQTAPGRVPRYKRYLDESNGVAIGDTWTDVGMVQGHAKERTGFPTQKPLALLRRIILASSREDDIVFDPFCGCATTCVAAEELDRQWIGIDISHKAAELVRSRLQQATTDRAGGPLWSDTVVHRTDLPQRTDLGKLPHYTKHKNTLYDGSTSEREAAGGRGRSRGSWLKDRHDPEADRLVRRQEEAQY